jgi:hypothetical protein
MRELRRFIRSVLLESERIEEGFLDDIDTLVKYGTGQVSPETPYSAVGQQYAQAVVKPVGRVSKFTSEELPIVVLILVCVVAAVRVAPAIASLGGKAISIFGSLITTYMLMDLGDDALFRIMSCIGNLSKGKGYEKAATRDIVSFFVDAATARLIKTDPSQISKMVPRGIKSLSVVKSAANIAQKMANTMDLSPGVKNSLMNISHGVAQMKIFEYLSDREKIARDITNYIVEEEIDIAAMLEEAEADNRRVRENIQEIDGILKKYSIEKSPSLEASDVETKKSNVFYGSRGYVYQENPDKTFTILKSGKTGKYSGVVVKPGMKGYDEISLEIEDIRAGRTVIPKGRQSVK